LRVREAADREEPQQPHSCTTDRERGEEEKMKLACSCAYEINKR